MLVSRLGKTAHVAEGFRAKREPLARMPGMSRPSKLDPSAVDAWLAAHPGWERAGEAIARRFSFADFAAALGFVVRVGCYAEKKDHHPDIELGWGRARVAWSTHDAGGITQLDLDSAEATTKLAS
jgi:4a-hydroxytetrahydrobiopterin dehydratase